MTRFPTVSVVVTTFNRQAQLLRCLKSIISSSYPSSKLQVVIVDDASSDGTAEAVESFKDGAGLEGGEILLLRNTEARYVSACQNLGMKVARGEYIFLVHDDQILDPYAIRELVGFMEKNKDVGICAPAIYYLEEPTKVWSAGMKFYRVLNLAVRTKKIVGVPVQCDFVVNPMLVRRTVCSKVAFDSVFFPMCNEDIEFCLKVSRLGYKVAVVSLAKVWHERPSLGALDQIFNIRRPSHAYYQPRSAVLMCKVLQPGRLEFMVSLVAVALSTIITLLISSAVTRNTQIARSLTKGFAHGLILMRIYKGTTE